MFAALFFCTAVVYAQSNDYYACRCRLWNGTNLSSLGVALNTCCSLKQSGYNVGTNFTGSGTTVGSQSGANVTCGTTVTPKIYTFNAIAHANGGFTLCDPQGGGAWGFPRGTFPPNDRCEDRPGNGNACYGDHMTSYDNAFSCDTMSLRECNTSQTDQQICNANGKGYTCQKSNTATVINKSGKYYYCMCDYPVGGGKCYEVGYACSSGPVDGLGSMQYLSCE